MAMAAEVGNHLSEGLEAAAEEQEVFYGCQPFNQPQPLPNGIVARAEPNMTRRAVKYTDYYIDWFPKTYNFTKEDAIPLVGLVLTSAVINEQILFAPFETLSTIMTKARALIFLGDKKMSELYNVNIEENLPKLQFSVCENTSLAYKSGFNYLLQALKFLWWEQFDRSDESLEKILNDWVAFERLSRKGQNAVLCALSFIAGSVKRIKDQLSMLRYITQHEPDNVEWLIQLYYCTRLNRKDGNRSHPPLETEQNLIIKCQELDYANPLVKLATCLYLTDNVTQRKWRDRDKSLDLAYGIRFPDLEDVGAYIRRLASEIEENFKHSVYGNLILADIFSVATRFRNEETAKVYILNALAVQPYSSRANHKYGLYFLAKKNFNEALIHFEKAYHYERRNFSALMDLIQALMSEPIYNRKQIIDLFRSNRENCRWTPKQRAKLICLFALWKWMDGEIKETLEIWFKVGEYFPDCLSSLKKLTYFCDRYSWNTAYIDAESTFDLVNNFVGVGECKGTSFTQLEMHILVNIRRILFEGIQFWQEEKKRNVVYAAKEAERAAQANRAGACYFNPFPYHP